MSKEFKVVESTVQPNPKEAEIWVTPPSQDGSKEVKIYNRKAQMWEGADSTNTNVLHIGGYGNIYDGGMYTDCLVDVYISLDTFEIIKNNSVRYYVEGGENDAQVTEEPLDLQIDSHYDDDLESTEYYIFGDAPIRAIVLSFQTKEKDWTVISINSEYTEYITAAVQHVVLHDHSDIRFAIENKKRKIIFNL